jgi:hypothetical protein
MGQVQDETAASASFIDGRLLLRARHGDQSRRRDVAPPSTSSGRTTDQSELVEERSQQADALGSAWNQLQGAEGGVELAPGAGP